MINPDDEVTGDTSGPDLPIPPVTADEFLREQARAIAHIPPEIIPDAKDLPHDVRDDEVTD